MRKTKIKHRISNEDINRIIDMFLNDITADEELKKYLKDNVSYQMIGLAVIATLDTVNENARWITTEGAAKLSESVIGAPMFYDHKVESKNSFGNFFYSKVYQTVDKKHSVLIGAFAADYIDINDFSKKSFSVGYTKNRDTVCSSCKMNTLHFFNLKDKNLTCGCCGNIVKKDVDVSGLTIMPHAVLWEKGKNPVGDTMFYPARSHSKLKQSHTGKIVDSNIYFMYIDNYAAVSEISIVNSPADALSAPLLAYAKASSLRPIINMGETQDTIILADARQSITTALDANDLEELDVLEFPATDGSQANNEINNITNEGEHMKDNAYKILLTAKSLGFSLPDIVDGYCNPEDKESEKKFMEAFTDELASKAITSVWTGIKSQMDTLKKTIEDFQLEKDAYLADKEAMKSEIEKLKALIKDDKAHTTDGTTTPEGSTTNPEGGSHKDATLEADPSKALAEPLQVDPQKTDPGTTDSGLTPPTTEKKGKKNYVN